MGKKKKDINNNYKNNNINMNKNKKESINKNDENVNSNYKYNNNDDDNNNQKNYNPKKNDSKNSKNNDFKNIIIDRNKINTDLNNFNSERNNVNTARNKINTNLNNFNTERNNINATKNINIRDRKKNIIYRNNESYQDNNKYRNNISYQNNINYRNSDYENVKYENKKAESKTIENDNYSNNKIKKENFNNNNENKILRTPKPLGKTKIFNHNSVPVGINNFYQQKFKINKLPETFHSTSAIVDHYPIQKVIFTIRHQTHFGEDMAMSGSVLPLGNWNEKFIMPLKWTKGNIWTGEIEINNLLSKEFEFKFVITKDKKVEKWEEGWNHKLNLDDFCKEISKKCKGKYNRCDYEYDEKEKSIKLKLKMNKV